MRYIIPIVLAAAVGTGAFLTRGMWWPTTPAEPTDDAHAHAFPERVKLSPQAQANLKLVVKSIAPQSFRRTIDMPGEVVERRGRGDQSFTAPATGVVKSIASLPGDTVEPGGLLLTLRLTSEALQTSQLELFKAAMETTIAQEQKKRLENIRDTVPQFQIVEVQNQLSRLAANKRAYRADLAAKGLTKDQIDRVEAGEFLREIEIRAPIDGENKSRRLELQELKVFPGDQVQAGQALGVLSNHQNLYIEGHGFREDTSLLERTIEAGWPLTVQFPEETDSKWPPLDQPLTILYLSNTVDAANQTLPFYVPLPNQFREYSQDGRSYRIWRYRPGQRVRLGVPVEEFTNVFVLPVAAVVREGAEAYVFRQNGDYFVRKPVHVVYEDSRIVVVANDGSVPVGASIAFNAAGAINRALKAANEEGGGHAGHSHEH